MIEARAILLSGVAAFLILAPLVKWYVEAREEMQEWEDEDDDNNR